MPNTSASQAISTAVSPENLVLYEVQKPFIEPVLRWGRLWNTALDILFYDVGVLTSALLARDGDRYRGASQSGFIDASTGDSKPYCTVQPERVHYRGG